MKLLAALSLWLALLVLASCASISPEACQLGDWEGVGYADGAAGRAEGYVANHAEACAEVGVSPDLARWRAGRAQGLAVYCTPQNAYARGARGASLNPVCAGFDRGALEQAFARGRRVYEINREIDRLEDGIAELDARIDRLLEGDVDRDERRLIRAYRREAARAVRTLRLLEFERAAYARPFRWS